MTYGEQKVKEEMYKEFERIVIEYPYDDIQELGDLENHIFNWFFDQYIEYGQERFDEGYSNGQDEEARRQSYE